MVASFQVTRRVIQLCEQAAELNREVDGRSGALVELNGDRADEVLISADLHGHRLNFHRLCDAAALAEHPRRHLILQEVCHGGPRYPGPGAGCMSHLLLEDVAELITQFPGRVHFLLGNHELAELTDFPITKGNCILNLQFRLGIDKFYGDHSAAIREAYAAFLRSCPLAVRLNRQVLVCHSLPEEVDCRGFDPSALARDVAEADLSPHGPVFQLLWGRDFRAENARAFAQAMEVDLLIHGHVPCSDGFAVPNPHQIILDCSSSPARYLLLPLHQPIDRRLALDCLHTLHG
jgi:hypothetical protein